MRPLLVISSLALLAACSGTEPTEPATPAFPGTIFVRQMEVPVRAPVALSASGQPRLIPVDLSMIFPDDGPAFFQQVISDDFDVSPDGRFLYVGTPATGLLRFDLPAGGGFRALLDGGANPASVQVSPGGQLLAFHQPQNGYATWIVANDGGRPQQVLPPGDRGGERYSRPVWAGETRLLVLNEYQEGGQLIRKVLRLDAPDWQAKEIAALRNQARSADLAGNLLATRDGTRIFLKHLTGADTFVLRAYSAEGTFLGEPIRFTGEVGRVLLSPDDKYVAATRGPEIDIYNLGTGARVATSLRLGQGPQYIEPVAWTLAEYR